MDLLLTLIIGGIVGGWFADPIGHRRDDMRVMRCPYREEVEPDGWGHGIGELRNGEGKGHLRRHGHRG